MKKIAIVLFVAATALAGCGKKKAPEAPAAPAEGSAAPAEGSAAAPAEGSAAPAEGAPAGGGM
jgi:hypothetical protein